MASTWFRRIKKGITTSTTEKKEVPEGLWLKCPECKTTTTAMEIRENSYVCPKCNYHHRINAQEYFDILFDESSFEALFENIRPIDKLDFVDVKPYDKRIADAQRTTGLSDAMTVAVGEVVGQSIVIACMNFNFIGGSMGSVMGEKIRRAVDYCIEHRLPYMIICQSGGARMQEATYSLMQLAKVQSKLAQLSEAGLLYIAYLCDPTFGGITASFAMTADIIVAEPGALIGFAGPRVIRETIGKDLPEGFQTSEFLQEKGFVDFIVKRTEIKDKVSKVVNLLVHS